MIEAISFDYNFKVLILTVRVHFTFIVERSVVRRIEEWMDVEF